MAFADLRQLFPHLAGGVTADLWSAPRDWLRLLRRQYGDTLMDVETTPFGDQENKELFFTGKMWDEDAQLYYFNARWYDPETGRFITEDPIKDGLLWYAYVNNNPMGFVDPTGLEQIDYSQMGDAEYRQELSKNERFSLAPEQEEREMERQNDLEEIRILQRNDNGIPDQYLSYILEDKMGAFNRKYFDDYTSQDRIPGSYESNTFGIRFEVYDSDNNDFYGAEHGGSDNVGPKGQQEYMPYFVNLVYADNNTVVYDVIGMDRFIGGKHITSNEVSRMNEMLGTLFEPGDAVHKHPAFEEGDPTYGRHEHDFEYDSNGQFYDPDTHQLPDHQPQQWRRSAIVDPKTGSISPGAFSVRPRSYSIPYLPMP